MRQSRKTPSIRAAGSSGAPVVGANVDVALAPSCPDRNGLRDPERTDSF
jgi:hypothetical protein